MSMRQTALAAAVVAGGASAQVVGWLEALEGDLVDGRAISLVSGPRVNGLGQVGYIADFADGSHAVIINDVPVFMSGDEPAGARPTNPRGVFGIGNAGQFLHDVEVNGDSAVWGQSGLVAIEGAQAPGFGAGFTLVQNRVPRMTDDGTSFWLGSINDGAGGTSAASRAIYQRQAGTGEITTLLKTGDQLGGVEVGAVIDFDFQVSSNGAHAIYQFNDAGSGSAADGVVAVDGVVIAQEGVSVGGGERWDNFRQVTVNNLGQHMFIGDTDGPSASDGFIAFDGSIVLREGGLLAGLRLSGTADNVQLNDLGSAVILWDTVSGSDTLETVFFMKDPGDLGSAMVLVREGDLVEVRGQGLFEVVDFDAAGSGDIAYGDRPLFSIAADLRRPGTQQTLEAIVTFRVPGPGVMMTLACAGLVALTSRRSV